MNMFREVVGTDQNIGASLRSDNQVERKFALQSVAAAMGMDVDTARRFLEGGDLDSVKRKMAKEGEAGFRNSEFKQPATDLTKALKELTRIIRRDQMDVSERMIVSARENELRAGKGFGSGEAQDALGSLGLIKTIGPMPADLNVNEAVRAMVQQTQVRDVLAMIQAGIIKGKLRNRAIEAIKGIADGSGSPMQHATILDSIRDQAAKESDITFGEMAIISKATNNLGLRRRLIKLANEGLLTDKGYETAVTNYNKNMKNLGVTIPPPLPETSPSGGRGDRSNIPKAGTREVTNVKVMIGNQAIDNKFVRVLVEKLQQVFGE